MGVLIGIKRIFHTHKTFSTSSWNFTILKYLPCFGTWQYNQCFYIAIISLSFRCFKNTSSSWNIIPNPLRSFVFLCVGISVGLHDISLQFYWHSGSKILNKWILYCVNTLLVSSYCPRNPLGIASKRRSSSNGRSMHYGFIWHTQHKRL